MTYTYVDPRVRVREWRQRQPKVEAAWLRDVWTCMTERIGKQNPRTCDLAEAAGVKPGTDYARFIQFLNRRSGFVVAGKRPGPNGHPNKVWAFDK